jgi:hypothetical protein
MKARTISQFAMASDQFAMASGQFVIPSEAEGSGVMGLPVIPDPSTPLRSAQDDNGLGAQSSIINQKSAI